MTTRSSAPPHAFTRREEIETPEQVALAYELADLGSRFTALLIDGIILAILLTALIVSFFFAVPRIAEISEALAAWTFGIFLLMVFALNWGYFFYFEGFRDGQTPGKRLLRIRTVHDGGFPLTVRGAAIRNLLRIIDIQPGTTLLVGGVTMMLHPRTKRLGDLAAGSIVVRERLAPKITEEATPPPELLAQGAPLPAAPLLNAQEFATLAEFLARRESLPGDARNRIAAKLVERLAPRFGDAPERLASEPDAYLERIHAAELAAQAAAGEVRDTGSAQATALARRQRPIWEEYRALLERAQRRGLHSLPEDELSRFATLYRETAADLARARTYGASAYLLHSLERWVGAGHNLLYRPKARSWRAFRDWLRQGFPALVRARWHPIALATLLFMAPAAITWTIVLKDPTHAHALLPPGMIARAEEAPSKEEAGGEYIDIPDVLMPTFASQIIANNIQVTFVAFAGGIMAGVGTILILILNGLHLGAVAGLYESKGVSLQLWSFVLPHGVIELTAIFIAGGAGLWLGSALILPGRLTRRDALVVRGREAVSLMGGVVVLLIIAGLIEGFISPAVIPRAVKLLFALAVALLLGLYLVGRRGAGESQEIENRK